MPESQRRPTIWIVLTCAFAAAAIGLGIWAVNAQSDADDAKAELSSQQQAASEPTPAPTPAPTEAPTQAPATATVDPGTQQAYDDAKASLGEVSEDADQLKTELDQASENFAAAREKADGASGALDKLRADADAFKAQAELTKTCLRGTLGALDQAYQSGGLEAAAAQLKALAGQCRDATS